MNRLFFYLLLFASFSLQGKSAITYDLNGGRFGDNLSTYSKAKWYAHKYKLTLLYKPFKYSDQLTLHTFETPYTEELTSSFDLVVKVKSEEDIIAYKDKNVLFVSNFYSQTPELYHYRFIDPRFERLIMQAISPLIAIPELTVSEQSVAVALHVRKGGGFDKPLSTDNKKVAGQYSDQIWPTKFPPDEYYIEQLRVVRRLCDPAKTLTVFLFTDDPNPAALAKKYSDALADASIQFVYRAQDNSHDKNVIEDFFLMARCECLIRSSSLLSKAAQLIGNHHIIVQPLYGKWTQDKVVINPVNVIIKN